MPSRGRRRRQARDPKNRIGKEMREFIRQVFAEAQRIEREKQIAYQRGRADMAYECLMLDKQLSRAIAKDE